MKQAFIYSLKVWLTTVILASFISMLVQSFILLPNYHLPKATNHYTDWLLQLAGTGFVNAVMLVPMGIVLFIVLALYKARSPRLKISLYLAVILSLIAPEVGLMLYAINSGDLKTGVTGMILNMVTSLLIALICVWRFELYKLSHDSIVTPDSEVPR